jgi:hypothetical protein
MALISRVRKIKSGMEIYFYFKTALTTVGSGWNVTVYVPTSMSGFSEFPWDPSTRQVFSNVIVPYLSYRDDFAEALSRMPTEDFALIATKYISVSAGYHQFCTASIDGSWLFVDGTLLVSNTYYGLYPACQSILLSDGIHNITVNYFKQQVNRMDSKPALEVSMDGSFIVLNRNGKSLIFVLAFRCYDCSGIS